MINSGLFKNSVCRVAAFNWLWHYYCKAEGAYPFLMAAHAGLISKSGLLKKPDDVMIIARDHRLTM